jgi:hypothetical protein
VPEWNVGLKRSGEYQYGKRHCTIRRDGVQEVDQTGEDEG